MTNLEFYGAKSSDRSPRRESFQSRCQSARAKEKSELKTRVVVVAVVWAVVSLYLLCPLSKARITNISGNLTILTAEDLYEIGGFSPREFLWAVDKKRVETNLKKYDFIQDATISLTPFGAKLTIDEVSVVGKTPLSGEEGYIYYLSDGREARDRNDYLAANVKHIAKFGAIPTIADISAFNENQKTILFAQLGNVPKSVRNSMVSIALNKKALPASVVDVVFDKDAFNLKYDLELQVDIAGVAKKLSVENVAYIADETRDKEAGPSGKYCYIYRAGDYILPCEG